MLTAAGLLTCRSCGTSSSSHMPLLVSKLRSVLSHWRARLHTPLGGGGGGGGGGMPPWGRGGGRNGGGGGGKPSVGRVAPCCMIGPAAGPGESDVWLGRTACTHRIQFLPSVCGCKKTCSVRQFEDMSRKPGRRVFLYFFCVGFIIFHPVPVVHKASSGDPESSVLSAKTFSSSIAAISRCSMVLARNLFQSKACPSMMSTAPAPLSKHAFKRTVNASTASRRPMLGCDGENAMNGAAG